MKNQFLLSAALAAVLLPSAAHAQSDASSEGLSGFRLELMLGYDRVRGDFGGSIGSNANETGVTYGIGLGYDIAAGAALAVGIDAELSDTTADGLLKSATNTTLGEFKFGREAYVGGRLTLGVSSLVAVTGKLGYSYLETEFSETGASVGDPANLKGPRAAVGVQFNTGEEDNTYFGLEGRYTDYNRGVNRRGLVLTVGHRF